MDEEFVFDYESLRAYMEIPGTIDYDDGVSLFMLALKGPGGNEPIIEIGCFKGRATAFMARACSLEGRGSVIAIDDFKQYAKEAVNGREVDVGQIFYRNLYKHRVSPWCIIMEGTSSLLAPIINRPVRMLYLGGSRQYDGLKANFSIWEPLLVSGGLVVVPDYRDPTLPEVEKFVDTELVPSDRFDLDRIWGGLIALRKK